MKLLKNLLVVIAATGMVGSGHALAQVNLGTLDPTVQTGTYLFGAGSFMDVFNFTVSSANQTVTSSTVTLGSDGLPSLTAVTGLKYELFSGLGALGTPLSTDILPAGSGSLDLTAFLTPGDFSTRISGTAGSGGGFGFSIAAHSPEPAEWMLMLCGLVVAGFIARRKIGLVAG